MVACYLRQELQAWAALVRWIGAWSCGDLDQSEALVETSIALGGDTVETAYFQFYQGFAREDFEKVFTCGKKAWDMAQAGDDIAWKVQTSGLIPSVRGLGEKGLLAPGYEGAIARAEADLSKETFEACVALGQNWDLTDVLTELEAQLG